jgi:class 3 adenylate cyclase
MIRIGLPAEDQAARVYGSVMAESHINRTLICSVVFLDIVEYSRKPVTEQIRLKDRFNAVLSDALKGIAAGDRIILDTGDGAAVSFIGDPEDALLMATELRDALVHDAPDGGPQLRMRVGINLGPVSLVRDINNQSNVIGDGINVAQRVMSFAEPGQVLVSRSYHEVVARLSTDYAELFRYEGARTDKHIREHEVYALGETMPGLKKRLQTRRDGHATPAEAGVVGRVAQQVTTTVTGTTSHLRRRPRLATALAVSAILAAAIGLRLNRGPVEKDIAPPPHADVKATSTAGAARPEKNPPPARDGPAKRVAPRDDAAKVAGAPRPEKPLPAAQDSTGKRVVTTADAARVASANIAFITLSIAPWGDVYLDGKKLGVSPPLQEVRVAAGQYRLEITNPAFKTHVEIVDAKPADRIRINHRFQ